MRRPFPRVSFLMAALLVTVGCGPDKPTEDSVDENVDPNLRIGHVMVEVGHRMETAGRAAEAENWELASYQAEEILEMFHMDMTRSLLPGVCDDSVSEAMYENLLTQLPELEAAAESEDRHAFATQFSTVSSSCNGCHAGCNVPFIRVPTRPGAEVPTVTLEEATSAEEPPSEDLVPEPEAPTDTEDPTSE